MTDTAAIFDDIKKVLEGNGTIPQAQRDRLMLALLAGIYEGLYGDGGMMERVKDCEGRLAENETVIKAAKWAAGIVGGALLLLLWALMTGQATLTIK